MFNKKLIAREWLYFLLFFSIGILLLFPFTTGTLQFFYECLIGEGKGCFLMWLFVVAPYLIFQLIRSIIWAIKQLKIKK
jgi:hypothetical protein